MVSPVRNVCRLFRDLVPPNEINGCIYSATLAGFGALRLLRWAKQQGCPWNKKTCAWQPQTVTFVSSNGHIVMAVNGM